MRLQYISDIHLEMVDKIPELSVHAENLALLGDIGYLGTKIYNNFIIKCSQKFLNVFVLFGNHEYYQYNRFNPMTMSQLEKLAPTSIPNVWYMNNRSLYISEKDEVFETYVDGSIKLIGSTLWSDINDIAGEFMNDYNMIYISGTICLTPTISREMFKSSLKYIFEELEEDVPCIVLTHHGTNQICNTGFENSPMTSAFVTDISELFRYDNLLACINGHTHRSIDEEINGVKFLANCYGYPSESNCGYNEDAVLEVILEE